ncbi:unnamed protein product [Effrenium voratum]|nr:unnamed protein product [Effrenium voratum]
MTSNGNAEDKDVEPPRRGRKLFGRTLINIFQQELNELCATLEARDCRHVRCLRPNDEQKPLVFDDPSMLRQCRYSGLLEATRIRRQGFAHRRSLVNFTLRYIMLLPTQVRQGVRRADAKDALAWCTAISEVAVQHGVCPEDVQVGHSKVFMRESALVWLESRRSALAAAVVSAALKGHLARRRFLRLCAAVVRLQAFARGCAARQIAANLLVERRAQLAEKAAARARALIQEDAALQLQSYWRSRQVRQELARRVELAYCAEKAAPEIRILCSQSHPSLRDVPAEELRADEPVEVPLGPLPRCPEPHLGRRIGEVRVGAPTCRHWSSRPLGHHEILSNSEEASATGPLIKTAEKFQVNAYPAGEARWCPLQRPVATQATLREVRVGTRSMPSMSPRVELRSRAPCTPTAGIPRALVMSTGSTAPSVPSVPSVASVHAQHAQHA